jgi:hypothetical protein
MLLLMAGFVAMSPQIPASPEEPVPERTVSVVSLNVAKETDPDKMVRALGSAPRLRQADLFLLQEVVGEEGKVNTVAEVAHQLGYHVAFAAAAPGVPDQGLALVSQTVRTQGTKTVPAPNVCEFRRPTFHISSEKREL